MVFQIGDLHHLAAEPDHQHTGKVGVVGVAPLRALQHLVALGAAPGHAAAPAHDEGHDAVDIGKILEDVGAVEGVGDDAGDGRRAVHAGEHADVVAGADLAVLAAIALEGAALGDRQHVLRPGVLGEVVVAGEFGDAAIVGVDVLARLDRQRGEADDLAELPDRLADGDRRRRHLVALGHARERGHPLGGGAGQDRLDGDHQVVRRMQAQNARVPGAFGQALGGRGGRIGEAHGYGLSEVGN